MHENDPFSRLPVVPRFTLTSSTIPASGEFAPAQYSGLFGVPGGMDISPQLEWHGAPAETKSYAVTVYDPDAPTGSGIWHWAVANIPASVTSLPEGAGAAGYDLPGSAFCLPNDSRMPQYVGAAPLPGHGPHRYFIVVTALDVEHVDFPADGTPAGFGFAIVGHVIGRAVLIAGGEIS